MKKEYLESIKDGRDLNLVFENNNNAWTSSKIVAEMFEKRHDNVLRDIKNLECSDDFRSHNFVGSSYINSQNHRMPCYDMTKDGLMYLVMGFTGKKAAKIKETFVYKFLNTER